MQEKEVSNLNSLYGHPPETMAAEKDLGIVFSNDLKVRRHRQCEADPRLRITSRAYE